MSHSDEPQNIGELFASLFGPPEPGHVWGEYETFQKENKDVITSDFLAKNPDHFGCIPKCERTDGVAVLTAEIPEDDENLSPKARRDRNNSVTLVAISDHFNEFTPVTLEIETAKKLVNALGTAIALIEGRSK